MNAYHIIAKKRDKQSLSSKELEFFVRGFADGSVTDYQMSAFLMAVFLNGMNPEETVSLTLAMMGTGKVLDLSAIPGKKVDKHSTGGVGDKVSLVLAPLVAAAGVKVPMVSGRTLGHTGGTLDKLESIPRLRTHLTSAEFVKNVEKVGFSIVAQSSELVPADEGMYALRGVTGTVESIPLIVSSILSKKFAAGIDSIVFDVKCGGGAFMADLASARGLAQELVRVCSLLGKTGRAFITDMAQPLGRAVGNALEVKETIECLRGGGPHDLRELTLELGAEMLSLAGVEKVRGKAVSLLEKLLDGGQALEAFRKFVEAQGGNGGVVSDDSLLPGARSVRTVTAREEGFVSSIDARALGELCVDMGGGRRRRDDEIDKSVGFLLEAKVGEKVSKGSPLCEVHSSSEKGETTERVREAFRIGEQPPGERRILLERVDG
ncbi:MAG: thymidine phosphorylase [Candidatus Eiseniibacteriota bacterium]|nr:MAG: thymidine phosphorylase [Candidatus Eisenbacteria bacterium]